MKKSIPLLVVLFAQFALSTGFAFAGEPQVVATLQAHGKSFNRVTLRENGLLTVDGSEAAVVASRQLGEVTAAKLTGLASQVANVEVHNVFNEYVCMTFAMVPSADLSVAALNHETYRFEGAPRLILTGRGCNLHKMTYPTEARDLENAEILKEMLEILAIDMIENR